MSIDLITISFVPLLFVFCYAMVITAANDQDDYAFVNLKNSDLKVKDLRALLDKRGLSYHDFNEKSEYINALIESGPLTVGELKMMRIANPGNVLSDDIVKELVIDIKFENDVPENVLNSKDEIWLIRIEPRTESRTNILEETVWRRLVTVLGPFEVQFGRFDCKKAADYCSSKSWSSPTLVLVVPRLHKSTQHSAKAEAYILKTIKNADNQWVYEADSVVKQVYAQLEGKLVHYLPTRKDFDGLQTGVFQCSVHFLLLTNLRQYPFLLSALAAKFNYGTHCFAYGPKAIAEGALMVPDNQVGAFYAVKSHYFYESSWQIISNNQSINGKRDDMLNAMVTFESLSRLLSKHSPIEARKPKAEKRKPTEKVKKPKPSPPPKYTYSDRSPEYKIDFDFCLKFFGGLLLIFVALPAGIILSSNRRAETRRTEEYARYRLDISNRDRSNEQNFWRDFNLQQQEDEDEESYLLRSTATDSFDLSSNQEFPLRSVEQYITIFSFRFQYLTDWHKRVFAHYNLRHMVCRNMQKLLAHYGINIEEIGFPPYNWILRLPTAEISDLSEDIRQSECPICQCSINNDDDRLCRLPCNCKDTIYHYDCIAPWLIKRDDANSHSFTSGKLHTERPCPTCRSDVTNWGLQQIFNDE